MDRKLEIATLLYHDLEEQAGESGFQRDAADLYKLRPGVFRDHLSRIEEAGREPALADEIDFGTPGRHVLLTFDDGGRSASQVGELLMARGWRGHFLVTTSLIGTRLFLNAPEIRKLRSDGHIIGSHSHTHPDIFNAQSRFKMVAEWRMSCDHLAQILGEPCIVASVPGGDISRTVLESASDAGIRYLFTSEPTLTPFRVGHCWILGRACARADKPLELIDRLAGFDSWTWGRERFVRRAKTIARILAAPLYQTYVRHSTVPR
jgi:peptidoglycan/xylan/chitin deacetylase (PgdA/CDA1 family)